VANVDEKTVVSDDPEAIVAQVKDRYGRIAAGAGSCCGPVASTCCGAGQPLSLEVGYRRDDLAQLPDGADLGLGCGAPVAALGLKPGETALDLGSGGGIDVFLAAREVGPSGHVIGVDMTPQMLERARANAKKAGHANVEFREGRLEALPVADASVDAVTSNCVINLVPDKGAVFREVARVLKPGGRMAIADIVLDGALPEAVARDVYAYVGCVAGAMERAAYFRAVEAAGLGGIKVLKDVDSLLELSKAAPQEAQDLLDRTGVKAEDLLGKVRAVTFVARKA
jgi:SAM-dependent methyltransferase